MPILERNSMEDISRYADSAQARVGDEQKFESVGDIWEPLTDQQILERAARERAYRKNLSIRLRTCIAQMEAKIGISRVDQA